MVVDVSGPIGFPETSVTNYQSTLRNIPEWMMTLLYTILHSLYNYMNDLTVT